jgi:calmodulin
MKKLGLNPTETEIQDLINEVEMNGYIYYPEFCRLIMRKFREDDDENFHQELYRALVGPKTFPPGTPATIYNVHKEFLTAEQFKMVMTNLPDTVSESEAEAMFRVADKDNNGRISYREFKERTADSRFRV